jgi:hypothetical protein
VCFGVTACGVGSKSVKGSGNVVARDIEVPSLSRLDVRNAFDVRVSVGSSEKLTIRVDDNLLDLLDVGVSGATLHIGLKPDTNVSDATLEADLTVQALDRMEASGASTIQLEDEIEADSLGVVLSGASELHGILKTSDGHLDLSGASRAEITGSATGLNVSASGASSVDGKGLTVGSLRIDLSGACSAEFTVTDSLSADASGASSLRYQGSPQITRQESSGASSITHG